MAERGKEFPLSIVIKTVDKATAGIERVNQRIARMTAPVRQLGTGLRRLGVEAGLPKLVAGFRGVGAEIGRIAGQFGMLAIGVGGAIVGLKSMIDSFDDLGDMAERVGLTADALAQLRYAAARSGASAEELDAGFQTFNRSVGQAKTGTGRFAAFLKKLDPALLKQVKGTKTSEEAFGLMADAIARVEDPTQQAALASAAFGGAGAALGPLLAKGSAGINELRTRYAALAGSQEGAAAGAGKVDDQFHDLKAATDGVKAALVSGLAPAFVAIIERLKEFFAENREKIAAWAEDFGKKLPEQIDKLMSRLGSFVDAVRPVWDAIDGLRGVAIALAVVIGTKLVMALASLSIALVTTPVGWVVMAIAGLIAIGVALVKNWDWVKSQLSKTWVKLALMTTPFGLIILLVKGVIAIGNALANNWEFIKSVAVDVWNVIAGTVGIAVEGVALAFEGMWKGIVWVFEQGWAVVKGIVDAIIGSVEKVKNAVGAVRDYLGGGKGETTSLAEVTAEMRRLGFQGPQAEIQARKVMGMPAAGQTGGRITVDFANAPKGTRVATDPKSTGVDYSVGYQLGGSP